MPKKKIHICLAASSGGHLTQLLKLSQCWKPYTTFFVSTVDVVRDKLKQHGNVYIVGEFNREHPLRGLVVLGRCLRVILKERPNVILSTGAAPGFVMCFLGKLIGAKVVWMDSIANVQRLSMSGRMIRPFANLCLTQWPDLAAKYKNVEYVGAVI